MFLDSIVEIELLVRQYDKGVMSRMLCDEQQKVETFYITKHTQNFDYDVIENKTFVFIAAGTGTICLDCICAFLCIHDLILLFL
jgi:ferredoxin-NADP reductase